MRDRIETDIYPTRYAAFDAPGKWAVFTPTPEGTYRSCRADAAYRPRSDLGAGVKYPGEMAVMTDPIQNPHWPGCTDGVYVEIGGSDRMGFIVRCHYSEPTRARGQINKTLRAPTLDQAIDLAEQWIREVTAD